MLKALEEKDVLKIVTYIIITASTIVHTFAYYWYGEIIYYTVSICLMVCVLCFVVDPTAYWIYVTIFTNLSIKQSEVQFKIKHLIICLYTGLLHLHHILYVGIISSHLETFKKLLTQN